MSNNTQRAETETWVFNYCFLSALSHGAKDPQVYVYWLTKIYNLKKETFCLIIFLFFRITSVKIFDREKETGWPQQQHDPVV